MNTHTGPDKLATHGHEKCIENVQFNAIDRNETTIKSTTKLDHFLGLAPSIIEASSVTLESFASVQGITGSVFLQNLFPRFSKFRLKLVSGNGNILGR